MQSVRNVMATYIPSVPPFSGMTRYDVLVPVIESTNAGAPLADGSYSSKYIIQKSNYANSDRSLYGNHTIGLDTSVAALIATMNSFQFNLSVATYTGGCSAPSYSKVMASNAGFSKQFGAVSCSLRFSKIANICADKTVPLATLINATTLNASGSPIITYSCYNSDTSTTTVDSVNLRSSVLSSLSNSSVHSLCTVFGL